MEFYGKFSKTFSKTAIGLETIKTKPTNPFVSHCFSNYSNIIIVIRWKLMIKERCRYKLRPPPSSRLYDIVETTIICKSTEKVL